VGDDARTLRNRLLDSERYRVTPPRHGAVRVAVAYPNTYRVAMASLAFQWVTELTGREPDVGVERAFADGPLLGSTLEEGATLAAFDAVAFSMAFEPDAPNVLRMLRTAGIAPRREQRRPGDPLVVLGGSVATINPLPLAPAVDVFCLGAAERTWPAVLQLLRDGTDRETLLDELASRDGYLVPSRHLDGAGRPIRRLRRLEKRRLETLPPDAVPASHAVTPEAEYRSRGLVEMSRGCPESCRYCWISHTAGNLRPYATEAILTRVHELSRITSRIGFVATAVGDHPEIGRILAAAVDSGLDVALSSLRIPAMVPEVLEPLVASGARSVAIAPETGSDALRRALGKPITNEAILAAVETGFRCGLTGIKLYFIVGLPGETDGDLDAIAGLIREIHRIGASTPRPGRGGPWLRASVNVLVPKPYTPYHAVGMLERREARRRLRRIERALTGLPGFRLDRPSVREARWQGYLGRAGVEAFPLLEALAAGETPARAMARYADRIEPLLGPWDGGPPPWHFITSAPLPQTPTPS